MSRSQLARLIDLPDESLQQVLDYGASLSPADAADHFRNLLGESPAALEFVAAFNARRARPCPAVAPLSSAMSRSSSSAPDTVPKPTRNRKKKAAPLHTPAARPVTSLAPPPGAVYHKKNMEEDYISGRSSGGSTLTLAKQSQQKPPPPPQQQPQPQPQPQPKKQLAGSLVQDALAPKSKANNNNNSSGSSSNSRSAAVKVHITGGMAMHGAASALSDLDAAIRALEMTTNPTLAAGGDGDSGVDAEAARRRRRCDCVATRHPLQTAAPNCVRCGKVVCVREGLGPCTACGAPLLAPADVQAMIRALRDARGREKMAADRDAHGRRGKGQATAAVTKIAGTTRWAGDDGDFVSPAEAQERATAVAQETALAQARAHRDRLLGFQAQNAQRTTVRDEAADFDVGDALLQSHAGGDAGSRQLWASPEERAEALRRQQKLLRKMEWDGRPEYEKRQQILSIDLTGKKVFRKTVTVARPVTPEEEDAEEKTVATTVGGDNSGGGGTFSRNPLLGQLIRPVYVPKAPQPRETGASGQGQGQGQGKGKGKGKGKGEGKGKDNTDGSVGDGSVGDASVLTDQLAPLAGRKDGPPAASRWRRVQDDLDNNEAVILDGGLYGATAAKLGDEPACG